RAFYKASGSARACRRSPERKCIRRARHAKLAASRSCRRRPRHFRRSPAGREFRSFVARRYARCRLAARPRRTERSSSSGGSENFAPARRSQTRKRRRLRRVLPSWSSVPLWSKFRPAPIDRIRLSIYCKTCGILTRDGNAMDYFLQQLINGITLGSIYALVAIGYTMVYGIIGMINFAHGDIFMVGSFLALIAFLALLAIGVTAVPLALFLVLLI